MVRAATQRLFLAAMVVLVALASPAASTALATASATEGTPTSATPLDSVAGQSNESRVETVGFTPSYDPESVLRSVERLRGLEATGPIVVHEYGDTDERLLDVADEFGAIRPSGAKALQLYSNGSSDRTLPYGYTVPNDGKIHVHLMNETDLADYGLSQRVVLAHELTHALQFQHEIITPTREEFREHFGEWTTDARLVSTSMYEGDAMVVTAQYHERTEGTEFDIERYNETLPHAAWPRSLGGTPYYYGHAYFASRDMTPEMRTEAIREPPPSSRGLLHADPAGAPEPSAYGSADLPDPGWLSTDDSLSRLSTDRLGELAIRHTFRINGFAYPEAAAAAAGWTDGRMYYFRTDGGTDAVYWTTAWENDSEARAFATAWETLLERNGATTTDGVTVVPADDAAPEGYYVIRQEGSTVHVLWAPTEPVVQRLAERAG